jgi:ribonuclease R
MTKNTKEDRLFQNLMGVAEQFMLGKNAVPLTRTELMSKLHLPNEHKVVFKKVLEELSRKGVTKFSKGKYFPSHKNVDIIKGTLKLHFRGFGFVKPQDPKLYDQDIFIPKHLTQNAVDGDIVEVEINPLSISEKGPEGKIITILERGRTHLAGIVKEIEWQGDILAYVPLLGTEKRVVLQASDEYPLKVGDRVIMEVVDWGAKETETTCRVTHFIGHISQPEHDIPAAVEEFDLRNEFPSDVIKEATAFGKLVGAKDIKDRVDFRDLECITIDPDTAKDFDDALTLTKDPAGNFTLGVHIADVSHYVKPGSAIDDEAKLRGNSTYFPGTCLPMLPGILSENLCSLRADVNRLAVSVMMIFDNTGNLQRYEFCRSVIKSNKRFTYKEAKEVLDGKKKSPHKKLLELLVDLCMLLKKKRYERGSIEFALPEFAILVDEHGNPKGTDYIHYDITHQLVEEFMLKANEVVAKHLSDQGIPITYRIHEEPSGENMKDFVLLAHAFGFELAAPPSPQDLQKLFDEALQTPFGTFLATSYIRRMRLAIYSPDNIGHYGLGLSHYCHFTSPIRRYVDLVVHRILFNEPMDHARLEKIAHHCSEQERISEKAENNVNLLKKLRFIKKITDESPQKQFEAVVTRVRNFGVYFEILDFMLEGFFHLSDLHDDYYEFDEKKAKLFGKYTGTTFFVGDKITVMLKNIDLIMLQAQWNLVGGTVSNKKRKQQENRKKSFRKKSSFRPKRTKSKKRSK